MSQSELFSLEGLELIMTYRGSTQERRENLRGVLRHIRRTYRDYTVYLIEADSTPTFHWSGPADANIRHVFIYDDGPFPKSRLCNIGARLCTGKLICFHDADMIANPDYLSRIVRAMHREDNSDAVNPFLRVINVRADWRTKFIETGEYHTLEPYLESELPEGMEMLYTNTPGAIVLFRRSEYMRVGGYDPRFTGWGGEDDDLLSRAQRLGVRWHSVGEPRAALFHLHHDSTSRAGAIASAERNRAAAAETDKMPLAELEARAAELSRYFD
jgi:cellulose synthase/poly-beta-1,6-N-acetylglucosamine synthase-like glycosyltransferase